MPAHPLVCSVSAVLAVIVATVGSLVGLAAPAGERDTTMAARPAVARITPVRQVQHPTTLRPRRPCDRGARGFRPRTVSVPGVTRRSWIVTPPRDANGIPGVPPLTDEGKSLFAW